MCQQRSPTISLASTPQWVFNVDNQGEVGKSSFRALTPDG
jgi:hypothetical protein